MKVVKIFFQDPTYYIHGTGDVEFRPVTRHAWRMDPSEAADLASS
jgi:hypothetical protein